MKNEKQIILISACLLGSKVRYDGQAKEYKNIRKLLDYYDIIPICPEVDGGLKIPRPKAEIVGNKVMNEKGKDVTSFFNDGAYKALQVAQFKNVAFVKWRLCNEKFKRHCHLCWQGKSVEKSRKSIF